MAAAVDVKDNSLYPFSDAICGSMKASESGKKSRGKNYLIWLRETDSSASQVSRLIKPSRSSHFVRQGRLFTKHDLLHGIIKV